MKRRRRNEGFTLIELLLVVVIIGILAAIVVPKLTGRTEDAKIGAAKGELSSIDTALDAYEVDNGKYPTADQGIAALIEKPAAAPEPKNWKGPYLKTRSIPVDPWGNPYRYDNPGLRNLNGYDLYSFGPNGQDDNGTGDDIEKP